MVGLEQSGMEDHHLLGDGSCEIIKRRPLLAAASSQKKMRTTMDSSWYGEESPAPPSGDHQTASTSIDPSKAKIFYKTKLCSKFKDGSCPFESRCTFAHGVEELRRPAAGWENHVSPGSSSPLDQAAGVHSQSFKTRPCKFFREGSCPYGDRCTFLHDEASSSSSSSDHSSNRPPNWKTRICNQWESSGHCSFADKCHFAHGAAELQKADNFQHKQLAEAAIYDCGLAWNSFDSYDQAPGDQQLRPPHLYGYGVYPALQNGFFGNGSNSQRQDDGRRYGDL